MMNKTKWHTINTIYWIILVALALVWILQLHTFGISVGIAALATAYFLYKRNRWAYFAAGVWYFGLLRIAMDDGHDFHQGLQSAGKLFYLVGVVFALILHEKVAVKKRPADTQNIPE